MDKNSNIANHFADVETSREHKGYFHSVGEALTTWYWAPWKNACEISQWAASERVRGLLAEFRYRKGAVLLLAALSAEARRAKVAEPLPGEMDAVASARGDGGE